MEFDVNSIYVELILISLSSKPHPSRNATEGYSDIECLRMVFETSENHLIAFEIIYKYKLMVIIRFLNKYQGGRWGGEGGEGGGGGGGGLITKSVFLNDL